MSSKNQIENKQIKVTEEFEPNAQSIVNSIKSKVYLEDNEAFEKRLENLKQLFEQYSVPDLSQKYPILGIWPFKQIFIFFQRVFRKLYYLHSQSQREAFFLLLDELRSLHLAVQSTRKILDTNPKIEIALKKDLK